MIISPDRTALVLIDLQDNSLETAEWPVHEYGRVAQNASEILMAARDVEMQIAHVALEFEPDAYSIPPHLPRVKAPTRPEDLTDAISSDVSPRPDEAVFLKAYRSAFFETGLHDHLVSNGIDTLVLVGVWTDACIFASVIDAVRAGYKVILAEDALGTQTAGMHQVAIVNMANRLYQGMISNTDAICAAVKTNCDLEGWVFSRAIEFTYEIDTVQDCYEKITSEFPGTKG
jgi:maleamate amidohydrolase